MNERSDRLMKALGDIGADLIAKAAPVFPEAPDTSEHGNIIAVTPYEPEIQLTKRDIRIYWITRILGAAAAIAIIGTGVFLLWKNWDKIAVREPDRPGIVTTVTNDTTSPDTAEPDIVDCFGQITDTSMPLPFEHYDSRYNSIFHDLWTNKFTTISNKLLELSDNDKDLELMNKLSETRCETPYTLDGNDGIMNLYWWMKELDVSVDEVCRAIEKNNEYYRTREDFNDIIYTIEELAAIQSGDRKTIDETFASEYCIIVGENVFSPKWLYYHTIEDYKAAGIPTAELNHKMSSYNELGLTDEAWSAFKVKLSTYVNSSYGADTLAVNIADNGYSFSEKTFGIFEDVFYGEWEPAEGNNADQNIILTYSKDMFTFENWIYPFGIFENDEAYVMPYMSGGVPECLIIRKDDPRVLYKGWWNRTDSNTDYFTDTVQCFGVDPAIRYNRINDELYDRELQTGEIGVWGLLRLISGGEQSNIRPRFAEETYYTIPGGFEGKGYFTDENGTEWVISGTKALGASKVYYLGGDGITSLTLGIRYYEKAAYETYINEHIDDAAYEPKEQYFAVSFTVDENGICRTTHRPLEEVYEEAKTKTYTGATLDYYEGLLPELELKDVLRVGESLSFQSAVVALRAPDGEIKASCPLASGMVGLNGGYSCTAVREPLVKLFNLENRRILIAVGLPLWESEFDRSYLTSFYLYDGDPILRRVEADGDYLEVIVKDSTGISPGDDGIYCTQPDGLILEYHIGENGHAALSPSQYN
ncbi:MAG: hypothetical protein IK990_12290 [Ruminiclostridium sp.]|nr:hypothetical protein [Ruminiclostridium sp.]